MKRSMKTFWSPMRQRWYIIMTTSTSTTTTKAAARATVKTSVISIRFVI